MRPSSCRTSRPGDAAIVLDAVSARFGVPIEQISGGPRTRHVTYARHIAMYCLQRAGFGVCEIGALLNRDHSTVIAGRTRIARERRIIAQTAADVHAVLGAIVSIARQERVA